MKTISIISLGCFRNSYDSEIILNNFINNGYVLKEKANKLDILIINTCGFIKEAKKESLETIERAIRLKKDGKVKRLIVMGCLVQRYYKE
ncbi:MAG: 30S ribosomal protein S12 methylthiotransferase RimO, partial [Candidatus Omnitrophica bacterium]|nr:30S ribosomal protein S12 methylthiotransferase RimO [Candidatus Omnitrophota bacterium]